MGRSKQLVRAWLMAVRRHCMARSATKFAVEIDLSDFRRGELRSRGRVRSIGSITPLLCVDSWVSSAGARHRLRPHQPVELLATHQCESNRFLAQRGATGVGGFGDLRRPVVADARG